jgi:hypothetical protein
MFDVTQTAVRFAWDIYAEIAAKNYSAKYSPQVAAEEAAKFADEMCIQRAARFPTKTEKKPK